MRIGSNTINIESENKEKAGRIRSVSVCETLIIDVFGWTIWVPFGWAMTKLQNTQDVRARVIWLMIILYCAAWGFVGISAVGNMEWEVEVPLIFPFEYHTLATKHCELPYAVKTMERHVCNTKGITPLGTVSKGLCNMQVQRNILSHRSYEIEGWCMCYRS